MLQRVQSRVLFAVLAALILAACGGGSSTDPNGSQPSTNGSAVGSAATSDSVTSATSLEAAGSGSTGTLIGSGAAGSAAALTSADCAAAAKAEVRFAAAENAGDPHGADMPMHDEHMAVLALVDVSRATHIAVRSGGWSQAANVWCAIDAKGGTTAGEAPGSAARAWIMPGVDVTVDGDISAAVLHTLRVSGTLSFTTTRNTSIKAATFVVDPSGTWRQGPIPAKVTSTVIFADDGEIDRVEDPYALGRGLVSHGKVAITGAPTTSYVSRAAIDPKLQPTADAHIQHLGPVTEITLDAVPVNWQVGGTLIFPATDWNGSPVMRKLVAISGNQLTIDQPLPDWKPWLPVIDASLRAHVGYLDRNVVFTSENKTDAKRAGHVMFMHSPDVSVQYARFDSTGRTDKISAAVNDAVLDAKGALKPGTGTNPRGRYGVHFHHTLGDGSQQALVKGCAITSANSWGAVNHDSAVAFEDNIVTDAKGAAFVTEVGTEIGRFTRNMVAGVSADKVTRLDLASTNLDWGRGGNAFFMTGFATPIDGAVITGVKDASNAIEIFAWRAAVLDDKGNPENSQVAVSTLDPTVAAQIAKGRTTVGNNEVPFTVRNVVAYSTGSLLVQHAHLGGFLNTVDNATIYGAYGAIGDQYSPGLTVTNSKFYGAMFNAAFGNDWKTQLRIENTAIKGFRYGVVVPQNGTAYLKNLDLANAVNLVLFRVDQYQYLETAPRSQVIGENLSFGRGEHYGYWAVGASTAWTDIAVPSDDPPLPGGIEPDYDERIALFFSRAGDASVRRHQTLFKPWNIQINGKQIYSNDQRSDFVVDGTGMTELDGKINAQLQSMCNMSMMDQLMPAAVAAQSVASDGWFVDPNGLRIWGGRSGPPNPNTAHFLHGTIDPYNKVNPTITITDQSDGKAVVLKQANNVITPGKQNFFCLKTQGGAEAGRVFHWISDML